MKRKLDIYSGLLLGFKELKINKKIEKSRIGLGHRAAMDARSHAQWIGRDRSVGLRLARPTHAVGAKRRPSPISDDRA